jgi:beta-lactamase regulating signal transducer with metallopeptidase domain/uncharacterized membrane protein YkoI
MERSSQLLLTFLLNACWQVALIAAVAAFCDWLLRQAAARHRHWLWVTALVLSFGLPALTTSHLLSGTDSAGLRRPQVASQQATIAPTPFRQEKALDETMPLPAPLPIPPIRMGRFIPINRGLAAALVALYFLFLCYRGLRLFGAWRKTRAMRRSAYAVDPLEPLQTTIRRCQKALGVSWVSIRCSPSIAVPVTVGTLKPLIILPDHLLQEADADVLTSAIGHELVHVRRRDYLLNLIYEFLYLPLSYHPAAALVRRRINQTRELGCDELVTEKLLAPEVYARSLVQLAGAAIPLRRSTTTITVGIADADILEERVMTMLKKSKPHVGRKSCRKSWMLVAATLCFAVPCMAAAPFALRININSQAAAAIPQQNPSQTGEGAQDKVVLSTLGTNTEAGTLVSWLKRPGDAVERGDAIAVVTTNEGRIKAEAPTSGVIEKLLVKPGEKVSTGSVLAVIRPQGPSAGWAISTAQQEERERKAAREGKVEYQGQVHTVQFSDGQEVRSVTFQQEPSQQEREMKERIERLVNEAREKNPTLSPEEARARIGQMLKEAEMKEERARAERESQDPEVQAKRRAELEARAKRQAELAKEARIPMQQAIQIASNQYPGTVMESRLVREFRDKVCYFLLILSDNGTETTTTRVFVNAIDGSIINAMKQER